MGNFDPFQYSLYTGCLVLKNGKTYKKNYSGDLQQEMFYKTWPRS